jgi:arylformamidase
MPALPHDDHLVLSDAQREQQYSPSSVIGGNYQPFIAAYAALSQAARSRVPMLADRRYGVAPRALLDFFPAAKQLGSTQLPGLLVFIHGGYWQELSKNESAFLAPAWHEAGFAHAVLGYTLAPQAHVGEIVAQCIAAIALLRSQATALGFEANNIVVAGSSAGGYLAAACAAQPSLNLRGIVPISGIFDLCPLVGTSINSALGLDLAQAQALSDVISSSSLVPAVICWGEIETEAFKHQSRQLAAQLSSRGQRCRAFEIPERNHFDVVHELGDPASALFQASLQLFQ